MVDFNSSHLMKRPFPAVTPDKVAFLAVWAKFRHITKSPSVESEHFWNAIGMDGKAHEKQKFQLTF